MRSLKHITVIMCETYKQFANVKLIKKKSLKNCVSNENVRRLFL